jgi:hypothetical protein
MASSGLQPGFEDAPAFPEEDAPAAGADLEEVARYAMRRGNFFKGTTAQRNAWVTDGYAREGHAWYDTTLNREFRHNGTGWAQQPIIKFGRDAGGTDVNGFRVVTHGMGITPAEVLITDRVSGAAQNSRTCRVENITATTFAVQYSNAGAPFGTNPVAFSWIAVA